MLATANNNMSKETQLWHFKSILPTSPPLLLLPPLLPSSTPPFTVFFTVKPNFLMLICLLYTVVFSFFSKVYKDR